MRTIKEIDSIISIREKEIESLYKNKNRIVNELECCDEDDNTYEKRELEIINNQIEKIQQSIDQLNTERDKL